MGYPKTWDDIEAKLKVLYPKDDERGKLRKKLLEMDDDKIALRHFQDSDASVKATLDGYLIEGVTLCWRALVTSGVGLDSTGPLQLGVASVVVMLVFSSTPRPGTAVTSPEHPSPSAGRRRKEPVARPPVKLDDNAETPYEKAEPLAHDTSCLLSAGQWEIFQETKDAAAAIRRTPTRTPGGPGQAHAGSHWSRDFGDSLGWPGSRWRGPHWGTCTPSAQRRLHWDQNLDGVLQLLRRAFDVWGPKRTLDFIRGGGSGFIDGIGGSCNCPVYRRAIDSLYHAFSADPALMTDGRRGQIDVPSC
ncbi:g2148 [Coccomyxa elongata]